VLTAEDIAQEIERRIGPLFRSNYFEVTSGKAWEGHWDIRIVFAPEDPGPRMGLNLTSPDGTEPITKLTVKQWPNKIRDFVIKSKSGPTKAIVDYVVDWFQSNADALKAPTETNPKTFKELVAYLRTSLARIPGLDSSVELEGHTVRVDLGVMVFTIGESPNYGREVSPGWELPNTMKLMGQGAVKFRGINSSPWILAEEIIKWAKTKRPLVPRMAALHRVISIYNQRLFR